jgi:hypothetical protein
MTKRRPQARTPARSPRSAPSPRSAEGTDWAFHADDDAVFDALASGRHAQSLREYFGRTDYAALSELAAAAGRARQARGPRVLILPGIMGSKLGGAMRRGARPKVLWIDPVQIAAGRLTALQLPAGKALHAIGVLLFSYARLTLRLRIAGRDVQFHSYDWRLGLDELGAQLAARIVAHGQPVILVGHSMGGLVARMAARQLPKRWVRKLIMLGTPNQGSFSAAQALRGTYPFVRKMSRLDRRHSPEFLAAKVFNTFPGLYQLLPPRRRGGIDLLDPRDWPAQAPKPDADMLRGVAAVRARLAPADARMVHIIGVNQDTVVGVRPSRAGFEYAVSGNGDGTVPLTLAKLPGLKCYFVNELHGNLANNAQVIGAIIDILRCGHTSGLPARWRARRAAPRSIDDAQLRLESSAKIDWRRLTSDQREAVLNELDQSHLILRV